MTQVCNSEGKLQFLSGFTLKATVMRVEHSLRCMEGQERISRSDQTHGIKTGSRAHSVKFNISIDSKMTGWPCVCTL